MNNSGQQFPQKDFSGNTDVSTNATVWIPQNGGSKYHSRSSCSGMDNPTQVAVSDAINAGYSKCGKCW